MLAFHLNTQTKHLQQRRCFVRGLSYDCLDLYFY
jgi:hypothetical protein